MRYNNAQVVAKLEKLARSSQLTFGELLCNILIPPNLKTDIQPHPEKNPSGFFIALSNISNKQYYEAIERAEDTSLGEVEEVKLPDGTVVRLMKDE